MRAIKNLTDNARSNFSNPPVYTFKHKSSHMSCLYAMTSFSCANETEHKLWVAKMSRKNWGNCQYFTTSPYRQAYAAVGCTKNGPPNKSDCIFGSLPQINCSSMLGCCSEQGKNTIFLLSAPRWIYTLFVTYIIIWRLEVDILWIELDEYYPEILVKHLILGVDWILL